MQKYYAGHFDTAVIGAGHAGIEAALASARLGADTALFTLSLDLVGNMPCNPAIGGTAKGHLVFEIDALGGEMGKAADSVVLQSRMLNMSKGPAVRSLRMQSDRRAYSAYMKRVTENTRNLSLIQAEITDIVIENGEVKSVVTAFGAEYGVKSVIIATGTSLGGRIIVGETSYESGPDNTRAAKPLTSSLERNGVRLRRFKTGTPPRIHADSIDYSVLERQDGDELTTAFSSDAHPENKCCCYITYTNSETHRIIRENLHRSPLFSGEIKGTGPRYCPSIEDKVVRFSDKDRHQLFIEPMGDGTKEMYIQGLSSSMPEEVQRQIVHSIKGLENAVIMRTAYAIEYDCCDPLQLKPTLEFKDIRGLFGAGQFNGSSGYEEAAAQGLIAGINAGLAAKNGGVFTLARNESYIGTLIDDLVTKGTGEPYRMMTSRSEYRLLLRQDNARKRLTPKARAIGLIPDTQYYKFILDEASLACEINRLCSESIPLSDGLAKLLVSHGYDAPDGGMRKSELLRRPGISIFEIYALDGTAHIPYAIACRAETEIKYEGYIKKQLAAAERFSELEKKLIPQGIDYTEIGGLRIEAMQKLSAQRPVSIGAASRISGVSPADISVLLVYLAKDGGRHNDE